MRSVYTTPEFWATVIGNIIGILVLSGVLTTEQSSQIQTAAQAIVGGLISMATLFGFIKAQAARKTAAAALMIARLNKQPDDMVGRATTLAGMDKDVRDLLAQL